MTKSIIPHLRVEHLTSFITNNPVAFQVGNLTVYYYGFLMGSAYCAAQLVALLYLSQQFEDERVQDFFDVMCFFMFPFAIAGARAMSWIREDGCDRKKLFRPGFWWHGGLVGTLFGCALGCTMRALPPLPLLDGFGLSIPVFEALNRAGCLSYGCCWGRTVDPSHAHAIRYTNCRSSIHRKKDPGWCAWRYPVQLYAVVLSLAQLATMLPFSLRSNEARAPPGSLFLLGMALSSLVRLVCEHYRGDSRGVGATSTRSFALVQGAGSLILFGCSFVIRGDQLLDDDRGRSQILPTLNQIVRQNSPRLGLIFFTALYAYGTDSVEPPQLNQCTAHPVSNNMRKISASGTT